MRGEYIPPSLNNQFAVIQEQQRGGGVTVLAGIPVYSSQVGGGFWSSVWSGIKSIGKAILPTIVRSGADFLSDIQQPGVSAKQAGIKRLGEASGDLLSMASEAVKRRTQGGQGRKRRRRQTMSLASLLSPTKKRRVTRKYKGRRVTRKRSVKRGKARKRVAGKRKGKKKRKTTRKTTTTRRRRTGGNVGGRRKANFSQIDF